MSQNLLSASAAGSLHCRSVVRKIAFILAALGVGRALTAQTPPAVTPAAPAYAITADFPYTTMFVFRGVELARDSLQPSLKVTSGDFSSGIWSNLPLTRHWETEMDFFGSYSFELAKGWTADAGATVYYYPGLNVPGADKTSFEGYFGINGTVGGLSTGTYAYYDFTLKAFTIQESVGYGIVVDPRTSVNFLATVGHIVPETGSSYNYFGFGLSVPYKLTDRTTISVGAQYADHNISGLQGRHFWGTMGVTTTF